MENFKSGLRIGERITDYRLGSSPVKKKILLEEGNWEKYAPDHEIQFNYDNLYDTLMCVTFSATDVLEYLFTYAQQKSLISPLKLRWLKEKGYYKNGRFNFSERFTGALGGTSKFGAYQYKVGDAIRKFGLIPQDMFPLAENFNDNIDIKFITQEMYDLGNEFIEMFPINYEWVDNIREGLKYAPLQITVKYADGDGILCPKINPDHAVVLINDEYEWVKIDDSYSRQFKKYCPEAIYSAMLYTVKFKKPMTFKKEKNNKNIFLVNDERGTKTMIVDFPTYEVFGEPFEEVDSLAEYTNKGTITWIERIID